MKATLFGVGMVVGIGGLVIFSELAALEWGRRQVRHYCGDHDVLTSALVIP